ncbi:two-component system sensor histidine kinase CreC [Cardiobacteriaceae bacterium TAE3-ERU3]|nr:two-component system sensor histidine kinase CreC [Cardiobacteriaceae bacterium TAE3-ERU3]
MTLFPRGISLRLFFVILATMVLLSWQFIERSSEHIETGTQQAVEVTLVDMANILAAGLAQQAESSGALDTTALAADMRRAQQSKLSAQIYDYQKQQLDVSVYVTNADGVVVYDSQGKAAGQDYSRWNDVYRALRGQYGARSSYIDSVHTQDGDAKQMVVGVPIRLDGRIIGMVAVAQPYSVHDVLRLGNGNDLRWLVLGYLTIALAVLLLMAWWLARALRRITAYAEDMAANRPAKQPRFGDVYLHRLAEAVRRLRQELNGKQTVEHYVHGLTHELKTPLTSIHAAAEILDEGGLSADERERFTTQIIRANQRMKILVERLLNLARLENREQIEQLQSIVLVDVVNHVVQDLPPRVVEKNLCINSSGVQPFTVRGDRILIEQALHNLLDNAIDFATANSAITISTEQQGDCVYLSVYNFGEPIPDYALPKLSERFFSLPRPDGTPRSSGLGLSFVAQIMALHHGSLVVRNVHKGVCVTLIF